MSQVPSLDLSGRVALVTGANHGIGRATALLLARQGASALVTYLRSEVSDNYPERYRANRRQSAEDLVREIEAMGVRAHSVEADLRDPETPTYLFDEALTHLGEVDILVNNATGHCAHDSFAGNVAVGKKQSDNLTPEIFDSTFAVDARASAMLIAEFARRYIERNADWGRIIGLTSGGPMGFPGEITYGAAKAAQENYTMAASIELGKRGVTANVVYPPVTDTGWVTDDVTSFVRTSDDHIHIAEAEDVARVIALLCSRDADMITGNIVRMR